jgi:hypothetical protein
MADDTITRGADLTEEDIAQLASDAATVRGWAARLGLSRSPMSEQIRQAMRVRLGRRERVS